MGQHLDLDYLPAIGANNFEFSFYTVEHSKNNKELVCVLMCDEEPILYFDLDGAKDLLAALEEVIVEMEEQQ